MSIESTFREVITGDHNFQGGRNGCVGYAENLIRGAKNDFKAIMGASESKSFATSQGDVVEEHAGHYHISYEKDYVAAVKSNMITMVNEGDYALSVQAGNYDTQIMQKARIYASSDILIESLTKVTLKVGLSTIVLSPTNIKLDFNGVSNITLDATGIKQVGPRIDLN